MKFVKIQDLTNRPVTSIELVSRYIFGDTLPTQFVAGTSYEAGQYTYVLNPNNGTVTVYYCTEDGVYDTIDSKWVVASIPSIVTKLLETHGCVDSTPGDTSEVVSVVPQCGSYEYDTYTKLPHTENTITLPMNYDVHFHQVTLYIDGVRKSELDGDYSIAGNTITTTETLIDDSVIIVDVLFKETPAARLLYNEEYKPTAIDPLENGGVVITVPVNSYITQKSVVFDLFFAGKYIPESTYSYVYDTLNSEYIITVKSSDANTYKLNRDMDLYNVVFTCSLSKEVTIVKNDISKTTMSDVARFQLDMRYTDFNDISVIHNSYNSGRIIPNDVVVLYNSTVHVEDEDYYLSTGDIYTISYKNIIINSIFDNDNELTNDYQEVVYVTDTNANTKRIPIPFVDFNKDINSLLVFKGNGYLVSSSRYYVKDNVLTFYPHDTSLVEGDRLVFQIVNDDYSIGSYMKTITITQDDLTNGVIMPLLSFSDNMFDLMVFSSTGMYITPDKYSVSNTVVKFNSDADISVGDNIEFVFFEYVTTKTNTTMRMHSAVATSDTVVGLPFDYNSRTDNVILFQSNGMYIDKSRYTITYDGTINITSGTTFNDNETINILLIRKYPSEISILSAPMLR